VAASVATPASLRKQQEALTRLALNDLAAMWRQISNAAEARVMLNDVLPALLNTYGSAAAAVAAEWYDEARRAADVSGSFRAIPADIKDSGAYELSGWATSKGTDLDAIRTLAEGGAQRRILNFSRQTVMGSSLADPAAHGWQRVGAGSCDFCAMLIGRGAVYSESSADFASHDHCHCAAAPAFDGAPKPVKPFTPSVRDTKKDQARAKAWIASH
jgi:hypothetical protein